MHPRQRERARAREGENSAAPKAIFGAQLQLRAERQGGGESVESDFRTYSESEMSGVSRFSCPESTPEVGQFCG